MIGDMSKGYMLLDRELMDSEDYFSERFTRMQAYIDLCLLASYKDRKFVKRGQIVDLKAGQLAVSEEELAARWKWSRNTVRKYLNEQQTIGNIEQQKNRLITITTIKFGINVEQQIEQQNIPNVEQQIEQQHTKEINNIKEEETKVSEKKTAENKKEKDELFEECWVAYRRKGSKKKSNEYWVKLSDKEKSSVLSHIKSYVSTREYQYQKDFERYLRDKTFKDIVTKGNQTVYDPDLFANKDEYHPLVDNITQWWNEKRKCLMISGYINMIADGYTDDTRPDGAKVAKSQYEWVWSKSKKQWIEQW